MAVAPLPAPRFIRRTQLGAHEYRKNFHQIDREIIMALTSTEADQVTPLMSKIYLRLVNAPAKYWERDGVLRIEAETREGKLVKAWAVLCDLAGVASATASKAIQWMHEQGIIGYFSGKNGVGLRIFLNSAASSVGARQALGGKKILTFPPASFDEDHASLNEPAFNDSFAVPEVLDTDVNSRAPQNGADHVQADKIPPDPTRLPPTCQLQNSGPHSMTFQTRGAIPLDEIVSRLKAELEPAMQAAARNAAAHEHERTRVWLENRGLPKAARVAQHEAYNVLRKYGVISETARSSRAHAGVGRSDFTPPEPHLLTQDEIAELAEACVAMLETKGQSIELTLSEMSTEAGGFLLPEDAPQVRDKANSLLSAGDSKEGK
jgi:hypothetical protein